MSATTLRNDAVNSLRELLASCRAGEPVELRRVISALETALEVLEPTPMKARTRASAYEALAMMIADPRIRSTGDLGRCLDASLNTEKACSLGGSRMKAMAAMGWVVRERFARWTLTDAGRAAHAARGDDRRLEGEEGARTGA